MKLVNVPEMLEIERQADASGLSYAQMMENAGQGLADLLRQLPFPSDPPHILGLVGSGNNGGDTLVALAELLTDGWYACAYLVRERNPDDELLRRFSERGGTVYHLEKDRNYSQLSDFLQDCDFLLDGILGTGVQLPLRGSLPALMEFIKVNLTNQVIDPYVIAVDCPSGLDTETGAAAPESFPADRTVCMAAVKIGLMKFPAAKYTGLLEVVDIGLSADLPLWKGIQRKVATDDLIHSFLPSRPIDGHKGTFGTALIIAGSVNYTGAVALAGEAAYRVGTGLVTIGAIETIHHALSGVIPEVTWIILPGDNGVISSEAAVTVLDHLDGVSAMCIGPGLGLENTTRYFIKKLLTGGNSRTRIQIGFEPAIQSGGSQQGASLPPMVVDADGLKLMVEIPNWFELLPELSILTPHPGEMRVLTGRSTAEIHEDRIGISEKYAREWNHIVVLKGANTVVASPDGRTIIIPVATPALATAGTGDVLAGVIVGLRAQGVEAFEAAVAGAWIHAQAGLYAADIMGNTSSVIASDVLGCIPDILTELGMD